MAFCLSRNYYLFDDVDCMTQFIAIIQSEKNILTNFFTHFIVEL